MHGFVLQSKEYDMTFFDTVQIYAKETVIPACRHGIKVGLETGTEWLGYAVTHLKALPFYMKQDIRLAAGTFAGMNFLFFLTAKKIAAAVDNRLLRDHAPLEPDQIWVKNRLLDIITGGAVFGFNALFSRLCEYPLSRPVQAALVINAMFFRNILN